MSKTALNVTAPNGTTPGHDPSRLNGPGRSEPGAGRRLLGALRELLDRVIVEPVTSGRLRTAHWPAGMRTVLVITLILSAGCVTLLVLAPVLRSTLLLASGPSGITLPEPLVWVPLAVAMFALSLFQVGAAHTRWWVRSGALVVTLATYSALGSNTSFGDARWVILATIGGCWLAGLVMQLVRSRAPFSWWEIPVAMSANFIVLIITLAPRLQTDSTAIRGQLVANAQESLVWVGALAVPVAIAAGFAVAQLTSATIIWSLDLARRSLPPMALLVTLTLVAAWRVAAEIVNLSAAIDRWPSLAGALALLAGSVLVWLLVDKLADRAEAKAEAGARRARDTGIFHLGERVAAACLPVAVLLSAAGLVTFVAVPPLYGYGLAAASSRPQLAAAFTLASAGPFAVGHALASTPGRVGVAGVLLLGSCWLGHRGRRGVAEVVGIAAVIRAGTSVVDPRFVLNELPFVATMVFAALLIVWALTRRLSHARVEGLLIAFLLCAVFGSRQLFADPFQLVVGGTAAVLLGLVWEFLTGSAEANHDTRAFPRSARVLLLLGNNLIGLALLAYMSWARDQAETINLIYQQEVGDLVLGGALIVAVLCAVAVAGVRNKDLGTPEAL